MSVVPMPLSGRSGPSLCVLSTITPPDGSHTIKQNVLSTRSQNGMPCFVPHGVGFTAGRWYHEVQLDSERCMQIGYLIRGKFKCLGGRSDGVGDDTASWALDGSKKCIYQAKKSSNSDTYKWVKGDIIGFALDVDGGSLIFSKNGTELINVPFASGSDYKVGDELVPAASLTSGESITWKFTADQLKYLPAGYLPIQLIPSPAELSFDPAVKSDPVAAPIVEGRIVDVLDDSSLPLRVLESFRPIRPVDAKVQAAIKHFQDLRGGAFEYGLTHSLDRSGLVFDKAFEGALPILKIHSSYANNGEQAVEKILVTRTFRRTFIQWLIQFMAMYAEEESARTLVDTILKPFVVEKLSAFEGAVEKIRYVAAIESRNHNAGNDSIVRALELFDKNLVKDRSNMRPDDVEKFLATLTTDANNLRKWIEWFRTRLTGISIAQVMIDRVGESLAKFDALFDPRAMEKEALEKHLVLLHAKFKETIERVRKTIKEADAQFERSYDRTKETYLKLKKELEEWKASYAAWVAAGSPSAIAGIRSLDFGALVPTPEFTSWEGEFSYSYAAWEYREARRLLERAADNDCREVQSLLQNAKDMIEHHRPDDACEKLFKGKEKMAELKKKDGVLSFPSITKYLLDFETKIDETEQKISKWRLDRAASDACRELSSAMTRRSELFDHYRNEEALVYHLKADELRQKIESEPTWCALEDTKKVLKIAEEKHGAFMTQYKERVVGKQTDDMIRQARTALNDAISHLDHHRHEDVLASLAKAKEFTDELKNDAMCSSMPAAAQWFSKFQEEGGALETKYTAIMLDRELSQAIRDADHCWSTEVTHLFEHHRHDESLAALNKYETLVREIENKTKFSGQAKKETFMLDADRKIPEFKEKFMATMLQLAYDQHVRDIGTAFTEAEQMFSHSRYEDALTAFHKYKETLEAMKKREDYGALAGGVRDAYVKKAEEETIPKWLSAYSEKVLGRKADVLARALQTNITFATEHLDHHRHENFLTSMQSLSDALKACKPSVDGSASTEQDQESQMLYALPSLQDAINAAYQSQYTLQTKYEAEMLDRKIEEAQRDITTALNDANRFFEHSNWDPSLTSFSAARQLAAEYACASYPEDRKSAFLKEFGTKAKNFEEKFSAKQAERRLDLVQREIDAEFNMAKEHFGHFRNEQALASLSKAKELLDAYRIEFPAQSSRANSWSTDFTAFEVLYRERVLTREADSAIAIANSELTFAEDHFSHHRYEKALETLSAARLAGAVLTVETKFQGLPSVKKFDAEFTPRIAKFETEFTIRMTERECQQKIRDLETTLTEMDTHLDHHRGEKSMESFQLAIERRAGLEAGEGGRFSARAEMKAADAMAGTRMAEFKQKYTATIMAKALNEASGAALRKLTEAEDAYSHHDYEKAIASQSTARELAGTIGADPILIGMPEVDTFLKEFTVRIQSGASKITEAMKARAVADARREVDTLMTNAKDHFEHHRDEASLKSFSDARTALSNFAAKFSDADVQSWIKGQTEAQLAFEKAYADRVFAAELSRKFSKAKAHFISSVSALDHHRTEEALKQLHESNEVATSLGSDDRFLKLVQVDDFLKQHYTESEAQATKIAAYIAARQAADFKRSTTDMVDQVESLYSHHRYEDSLALASKARDAIDASNDEASIGVKADLTKRLDAFRTKYQQVHMQKEADALIRGTESQLDNAKFLMSHHRNEEAIAAVGKARELAQQLGDDNKFAGLASVDTFFSTWAARVKEVQNGITERLSARRMNDAMREIASAYTESASLLDKHIYESSIERLQKVNEGTSGLRGDAELFSMPDVKKFVMETEGKSAALQARIVNTVYGREVDDAIRTARGHLTRAQELFERFAYEPSLIAYSDAREIVLTTSADERFTASEAWKKYSAGEWKERSGLFATTYGEKVLGDEARALAATVRGHLAKAQVFLDRNVREKAEETIAEAVAAAEPILDLTNLLHTLAVSASLRQELIAVQSTFAKKYLEIESNAAIVEARKYLAAAKKAEQRALDGSENYAATLTTVQALIGTSKVTPVASAYASLPSVVTFITSELIPAFAAANVEVFSASPAGAGGLRSSGNDASVDAILGDRLPFLKELRKGVPFVPIGFDVNPKFFSCLKQSNQHATIITRELKNFENVVKNRDLTEGSILRTQYLLECMDQHLIYFGKELSYIEKDFTATPDDPLWRKLNDGYASFKDVLAKSINVIKRFDSLGDKHRSVMQKERELLVAFKQGVEILHFEQSHDTTHFMNIVRNAQQQLDNIERWAKEFDGKFVTQEYYKKTFGEMILRAKKMHVEHCIRHAQMDWHQTEQGMRWLQALSEFPLARAKALQGVKGLYDMHVDGQNADCGERDYGEIKLKEISNPSDRHDPDEKPEWYADTFVLVKPGLSSGLPFRNLPDNSTDVGYFTAARKAANGRILFSSVATPDENGDVANTTNKFKLEEVVAGTGIHARAFWPRAIRNYALGKDAKDGKPLYGPEYLTLPGATRRLGMIHFLLFVKIDGKLIDVDIHYGKAFTFDEEHGSAERTAKYFTNGEDTYAWRQTKAFHVLSHNLHENRQMRHPWEGVGARFALEFSKLSPGEHQVELELCFRYSPTDSNWTARSDAPQNPQVFPAVQTIVSEPISTGTFTLVVPNVKVPRRSLLPLYESSLPDSPANRLATEKIFYDFLSRAGDWGRRQERREIPLHMALRTNWYDCAYDWFEVGSDQHGRAILRKEVVQRARDFVAVFRRTQADGWKYNACAVFELGAYAPEQRNPPSSFTPMVGVGVSMGRSYFFPWELLSEADQALAPK